MDYYIIHNGQQVGPMPKEQLVSYGLCPTSKVWCEGMPNWADASTVPDLQSILYPQQPPTPQPPHQGGYQQPQPPYGGAPSYNHPQEIGFGDAIKICFNKFADFEGRARRSEFWWWYLFNVIVSMVVNIITIPMGYIPGIVFSGIISLILLLPNLAAAVRRLHDTGRSGWMYLIGLIPCIGIIFLIIWFCEDSQGDNEYGPSPKYPGKTM